MSGLVPVSAVLLAGLVRSILLGSNVTHACANAFQY